MQTILKTNHAEGVLFMNSAIDGLIPGQHGYEEPDCFACHDAGCYQCATDVDVIVRGIKGTSAIVQWACDRVALDRDEVVVKCITQGRGFFSNEFYVELNIIPGK